MELTLDELYLIAVRMPDPEAFKYDPELAQGIDRLQTRIAAEICIQEDAVIVKRNAARSLTSRSLLDLFLKAGRRKLLK